MKLNKSKKTKNFNFSVSRNTSSHKAGANTVSISTRPDSKYGPNTQITMTVKEARALNGFLTSYVSDSSGS